MNARPPLTVACFGLPGFGNDLLSTLRKLDRVRVVALYTRRATSPFPYYDIEPIEELAARMNVPVFHVPAKGTWDSGDADLAIVSSFHRILRPSHLARYRRCVNIHPSLLPAYRGATPTNWMCNAGERVVGVTAHLMDDAVDTGPIVFQRTMLNPALTDGELRRALSFLSTSVIEDVIESFPDYTTWPTVSDAASRQPPRTNRDSIARLEDLKSIEALINHIKAFTNHPMPKIEVDGRLFVIDFHKPKETLDLTIGSQRFCVLGYWSASEEI